MADYDSPWKEALALFFAEFQAFFFPEAHRAIDWSRGIETLDKELQQVIRDGEAGRRYVDHLVKVWLTSGAEEWLLVHVEVQTQPDTGFATRLYTYNYRLFDRYQHNVVTQVVLADDSETWRPNHHEFALWGFRVRMDFPTVKLLDIIATRGDLDADPNPFAVLAAAHVRTMQTHGDPDQRRAWKFGLVKSLYQRGLTPDTVRKLFHCIDWMMDLPKPLDDLFWADVNSFEKENKMPFIDIATRKGMEKGIEKGMEKGIEKGTLQTLVELILLDWEFKFGEASAEFKEELGSITDIDLLKRIFRMGKTAGSLDELRKLWKAN